MDPEEKAARKERKRALKEERRAEEERREHMVNPVKGATGVIGAALFYVVLPYVAIAYLLSMIEGVMETEGVEELLWRWIYLGIPIVIVAFPKNYYPKGSYGRLGAWIATTALSIAWVLYVLNFGDLSDIFSLSMSGSVISLDMSIAGLLIVMIIFRILKLVIAICDHVDHREGYLRDNGLSGSKDDETDTAIGGRYDRG